MLDGVLNVVMRDDVRFARVRLVAIRVIVVEMRVHHIPHRLGRDELDEVFHEHSRRSRRREGGTDVGRREILGLAGVRDRHAETQAEAAEELDRRAGRVGPAVERAEALEAFDGEGERHQPPVQQELLGWW